MYKMKVDCLAKGREMCSVAPGLGQIRNKEDFRAKRILRQREIKTVNKHTLLHITHNH